MKRTNDSKQRPNHFTIVPPAGQTRRQTVAKTWMWAINHPEINIEFSSSALDLVGEDRRRPLVAIAALQEYGTAAQIAKDIVAAKKFIATVSDQSVVTVLEEKVAHMEQTRKDMEASEKILAKAGRKIDPKTGKAVRDAKGHRGKELLVECIEDIFSAKYKDEYPDALKPRKRAIRKEIRTLLIPYFDENELSYECKAPIDNAIRNWITRTR